MKTFVLLFFGLSFSLRIFAVEGMWLPLFIEDHKLGNMQEAGLKLSADDIYHINNSSLKDAVLIFGRGCTGSVISPNGLIITNHHCAYRVIQSHSSTDNDILTNGYWADSKDDEIVSLGLSIRFLVAMKDVTEDILKNIPDTATEKKRDEIISKNSEKIISELNKDNNYSIEIKPFFNGNQFFAITMLEYKDIRLVGAPPSSIGKFGGDTDNWMWPRHSGDFALFRIYGDKNGQPATFSTDNIPLSTPNFLPVSMEDVNLGDFTMVYGFPGSTQYYLPAVAVKQISNIIYPERVKIRSAKLDVINDAMEKDHEVRLKYTAKASSISNAWKKWQGEIRGLKRLDAVNRKKEYEKEIQKHIENHENFKNKHASLFDLFYETYEANIKYVLAFHYYREAALGTESIVFASRLKSFEDVLAKRDSEEIEAAKNDVLTLSENHFQNYDYYVDKHLFAEMTRLYHKNLPEVFHPAPFEIFNHYDTDKGDAFLLFAKDYFAKSVLTNEDSFNEFINNINRNSLKKLRKDPIYNLMNDYQDIYRAEILPKYRKYQPIADSLNRVYMNIILDYEREGSVFPDANGTLRITYGNVDTYYPSNGVKYHYYTTLDGVAEKHNPDVYEFNVPEKLLELHANRDYGIYADNNGNMRVCFISSNHTTGGNSGSPIINAKGEVIGINFDRNWEGTMSDIMYDPDMNRNISVDINYVLFIIDQFANAPYLINEMEVRNMPE